MSKAYKCKGCGVDFCPSRAPRGGREDFCAEACYLAHRNRWFDETFKRSLVQRTDRSSGCWVWRGLPNKGGYVRTSLRGVCMYVHRASWVFHNGPIPDGMLVCHKCDNPPCCNPEHLFLGTHKDNANDAAFKGRLMSGDKSWTRHNPEKLRRGEAHHNAKLNKDLVLEIRSLYSSGEHGKRALARRFCLDKSTISSVVSGKTWRHV